MMQQTRLKTSFVAALLAIAIFAKGQEFRYSAKLDSVQNTGFYAIHLSSDVLSYLRTDHADLRIEDKDRKQVPYLLQIAKTPLQTQSFIEFPILSNRIIDSGKTEIMLSNDSAKLTANIKLFIKNAAVSRLGSLSGSNDRQKWFIIDDQVLIGRSYESLKDEYLQEIIFPASTYRFYKLVIDNQKNDPMNIIRAGSYTQFYWKKFSQFEGNPDVRFKLTDSGRYSLLDIQYNRPYHISRLTIWASGPKYFRRDFELYSIDSVNSTRSFIGQFTLNSKTAAEFEFHLIKSSRLRVVIDNKDNPPLKIDQLLTEHLFVSATAYLEKSNSYTLLMDNADAKIPDYDLVYFKDSIPQSIGYLNPQVIIANPSIAAASENRKWWLWPVLIGVIAIMGFLTYKLIRDVNVNRQSSIVNRES